MSNYEEHFTCGAIASSIILLLRRKARNEQVALQELFGAALLGGAVASLPDEFEPATGPNHRGLAHSATVGMGLTYAAKSIHEKQDISDIKKDFILAMVGAYGSHLLLDSQTPAGLPLFEN